ncbi:MAG TPA: DinB family protein [Terriglobales bacterium]|nr:DinB family protein [Terriglobales bacterium]
MIGRPASNEAAPYYSGYIGQVPGDDPLSVIKSQLDHATALLSEISEEKSLHRYVPEKWSIRQVLSHINDTERAFVFRALWFARGFDSPLPSFDQEIAAKGANADEIPWAAQIEEFRFIRQSTISLFQNLPSEAWMRTGIASGNPFTVRALAFIIPGHVAHHLAVLKERYL